MKRAIDTVGILAVLVVLSILVVAVVLSYQVNRPRELDFSVLDSPLETPTQPVEPTSAAATSHPTSLPQPTATDPISPISTPGPTEVPPSSTPSPTPFPTAVGPLPSGLKIVFTEMLGNRVNVWAASVAQPDARQLLATVESSNNMGLHISLAPEGYRIAYTVVPDQSGTYTRSADLRLLDLRTGQERTLATDVDLGGYEDYPLWSLDGSYLAYRRESSKGAPYTQSLVLMSIDSEQEQIVASGDDTTWLWWEAWSPDGRYVYFTRGAGHSELWRLDVLPVGSVPEFVHSIPGIVYPRCRALSPDGLWLVCTVLSSQDPVRYAVILVPTNSTGEVITVFEDSEGSYSPIWSPDGREVLINKKEGEGGGLLAIDINTRAARTITTRQQGFFIPQGFAPGGQWIIAQTFPNAGGSLLMIQSDGTQVYPIAAQGLVNLLGWITDDSVIEP